MEYMEKHLEGLSNPLHRTNKFYVSGGKEAASKV
jgi:hypothetical protein